MQGIINNPKEVIVEDIKNRLILIGNGFDLALGNKTSYNDFIIWFLRKEIIVAIEGGRKRVNGSIISAYSKHSLLTISAYIVYGNIDYRNDFQNLNSSKEILEACENLNIEVTPSSEFFATILNNSKEIGWVDIEDIYYTFLKKCLNDTKFVVKEINDNLKALSVELEKYLKSIETINNDWTFVARSITEQVFEPFHQVDFIDGNLAIEENPPKNICFLDFNYTNSLQKLLTYPQRKRNISIFHNHIHGEIDNINNPIIFGFGDEYDATYKEIENKKDNNFFEHIKSFKYLNTPNYHLLLRFLEAENFQVYIYGHSCGLSDKTMLKHIFEHENCKSIKLFYYENEDGRDDFEQKTMDISRHFDNKGLMRKLIVNKEYSEAIPQHEEKSNKKI